VCFRIIPTNSIASVQLKGASLEMPHAPLPFAAVDAEYNTLPGETEAGTAGTQPCRGMTWWAHRADAERCESLSCRTPHRPEWSWDDRPPCLENPCLEGTEPTLQKNYGSRLHQLRTTSVMTFRPLLCSSLCAGLGEPARPASGKKSFVTGADIEYACQFSYNPSPRKFRHVNPS